MSRVSLVEQLYVKRKSALEFNYDALWAPPIRSIFSQEDINELYRIATSLKYNGNIEKKYELIDSIMRSRGFIKAHSGTNRVVYNFLELPTFVAKVAVDRVGMKDSPAEYKNQNYFKPFCCKIFEVDPTGVLAFVERVNPITSLEEFLSVSDDVFNLMITKIIGKYVVDDLGVTKYMNYGLRYNANGCTFGPVIIDFPYAYELDDAKLICKHPIRLPTGEEVPCNGEIDYDEGLNGLFCTKCGREYKALDLQKHDKNVFIMYSDNKKGDNVKMRSQIVDKDGNTIMDSGFSSDTYISKEDYESLPVFAPSSEGYGQVPVNRTYRRKYDNKFKMRREVYSQLQTEEYNRMQNAGVFNSVGAAFELSAPQEFKPSNMAGIMVPVDYDENEEIIEAPVDDTTVYVLPTDNTEGVCEYGSHEEYITAQPGFTPDPIAQNVIEDLAEEDLEFINRQREDGELIESFRSAVEALEEEGVEFGDTAYFSIEIGGKMYNIEVEYAAPKVTNTPTTSGAVVDPSTIITDLTHAEDECDTGDTVETEAETEEPETVIVADPQTDSVEHHQESDDAEEEDDDIDVNDMVPPINPNKQYRHNGKSKRHNRDYDDDDDMDEY